MQCAQCRGSIGEAAKFCPECGAPQHRESASEATPTQAPRAGLRIGDGERRQLTVMFCDLVGSTDLSMKLDPEDMREVVRSFQSAASHEVVRFGGHVAQLLGDGLLVYFGYPVTFDDAAPRAVSCALAIISALAALNAHADAAGRPVLRVRIGLHTGTVVVGQMGGAGRSERLAIGDTPNIAARIQSLAEPDTVYLSEVTAALVSRRMHLEPVGPRVLKGVRDPVMIHRAIRERDVFDDASRRGATPLVDREEVRNTLLKAWRGAAAGGGRTLLLSGEGGIGKSRVVQALCDAVEASGGDRLELRCHALDQERAFGPFVDHLQAVCGMTATDGPGVRLARLTARVEHDAPALQGELPVLAALMLLPPPPDADSVNPMTLRGRIQQVLERWVLAHAGRPLLLVVEDLHWADASSREVLQRIVEAAPSLPMLVVITFRPQLELPDALRTLSGVSHLVLARLERQHVERIVENVSGGRSLPASVVSVLLDRIDGVPIYAEELTRNVLATHASTDAATEIVIPTTLQDALMARLDRLGPIRGLAQMAAVIGRHFDYATLRDVAGVDEAELQRALQQLVEGDVLVQSGAPPVARFAFRHALLHEATYGALLRDARQEMHALIGSVLERRASAEPEAGSAELVRQLAHHWHRAVAARAPKPAIVERAIVHLVHAGELQLAVSGYGEAQHHLGLALEHVGSLPPGRRRDELELRVRLRQSTVFKATVGPASEQVRETLSRCRELCHALGDRPELGSVLYGFWQLHLFRAQYPMALALAEECQREARRTQDPDLGIQAHVALANTQFWFCELDLALENALAARALYDPSKHARHAIDFGMDPGVLSLMFASWVPQLTGQAAVARAYHEELLRLADALEHPLSKALALNTSCCFYVNEGDVAAARAAGEALLALAQTHGMPVYAMFGVLFRGCAMAEQGYVEQVLEEVRQTYRSYITYVGGLAQTYAALLVCSVFARAGCIDEALAVLENVLGVAEAEHCRELAYHAELVRLRGELLARRSPADPVAAEASLRRAVTLARARRQPVFALRAARSLATLIGGIGGAADEAAALVEQCEVELAAAGRVR
jgi:class 3 adenylate cyclase